jgi:PadR family transcriptional regulator, regulatory protein PadR
MVERLNELEEAVLLMVGILGDEAYPARISDEFQRRTSRTLTVGAIHSVLDRLESKGFADSVIRESGSNGIKRRKRIYSISNYGRQQNKIPFLTETLEDLLLLYHTSELGAVSWQDQSNARK